MGVKTFLSARCRDDLELHGTAQNGLNHTGWGTPRGQGLRGSKKRQTCRRTDFDMFLSEYCHIPPAASASTLGALHGCQ
jgi:hypothetical protein